MTPNRSLALIVTVDEIESLWLDDLTDEKLLEMLETWFEAYNDPDGQYQSERSEENLRIYNQAQKDWLNAISITTADLWQFTAPIVQRLQTLGYDRATLIPTGFLSLLPLHSAWAEDPTTPTGKRYALDDIHFTYAPNARSLTAAQDIAQRTGVDSMLAIENPVGDLALAHIPTAAAIGAFPQHQVLKHSEASIDAVRQSLPKHNILHLFCHGTANLQEPLTSGLRMNDGLLTLRDLLNLKLAEGATGGIRLAILSACETSLQGIELADEAISLPTGLLQAGVAGVIGSLWSVDEFSTILLLVKFYDNWRNHQQAAPEALRQAQQWLRDTTNREKESYFVQQSGVTIPQNVAGYLETRMNLLLPDERTYAHPYHWAAFQYVGV